MERQKHVDDAIESVFEFLSTIILMNHDPDLWSTSSPHNNVKNNNIGPSNGGDRTSLWYIPAVRLFLVAILNHTKANNIDIDPMSTHELDAENLEKMLCHPGGRRIVITQQSQSGDGNGENDLNNQPDLQQSNRKIGTLYVKPEKKVRVAACDRRIKKLKKVMKAETLEAFLEALGLGKYSLIFRSEEYDMKVLLDVNERDLVSLGIPVGPGRSILQALKYKA